ncbi:MAG: hypothetical protein ACHQQ3_03525 [Gemmatimonadales bacterium]
MHSFARAIVLLLAARLGLLAQDPGPRGAIVTVQMQPESVTVGEPFIVRVRVRTTKSATIRFPAVPDSGDAIEAVDPRAIEDAGDASVTDRTAIYRLVAWNVGNHTPRLGDVTVSGVGAEQRFPVTVSSVHVRSLLPADSTLRVPKDARAPVPPASGLWRYLLLLGVFLSGLVWWLLRRRRQGRPAAPPIEPEAFSAATDAFQAIDALALVEAGEAGRHVIAHVDVLRAYVARRFPVANEALTKGELIRALSAADFPLQPERVGALLERESDVRFAAEPIEPAAAAALAKEARAIVRDVQTAHEARLKTLDRGPQRARRARRT